MGAGLSKTQVYARKRAIFRRLERELREAGVPCRYANKALRYGIAVPSEKADVTKLSDRDFEITYSGGNMSNGETVIMGTVAVTVDGKRKEYFGFGTFEQGMTRIKREFGSA